MPAADLVAAAHMYATAERACILWGLGVTEHRYGSECVRLICNLALLTGNVGRPGAALLPLRGQNNVQGSSDHGALPDTFTDYRHVSDEAVASQFEERWGVEMKREPGMKIPEMFDAAVEGRLKAMYIFGEDVAQTDPDTAHVEHALESLDFLVCQDIFENETTKYADVILPASSFLEKTGTFTNAERRVQLVRGGQRPARGGQDGLRDPDDGVEGARLRHGLRDAHRRDGRDRRDDAPLRRDQPRAGRAAAACSGRSRPTAPTRRSCTRTSSRCPAVAASSRRSRTSRPATPPTTSSR